MYGMKVGLGDIHIQAFMNIMDNICFKAAVSLNTNIKTKCFIPNLLGSKLCFMECFIEI